MYIIKDHFLLERYFLFLLRERLLELLEEDEELEEDDELEDFF